MAYLALLPNYVFTTQAWVVRAPLVSSPYGLKYDWPNATSTDITGSAVISPLGETETGSSADHEFRSTHFNLLALPNIDLLATDRVRFNPGNGIITTEVDGDPFVWSDPIGRAHHIEAKLKIFTGVNN